MEKHYCPIHKIKIVVYSNLDEEKFNDNDEAEIAIFYDNNGDKYLKRFVLDKCNENCPTIQKILNTGE